MKAKDFILMIKKSPRMFAETKEGFLCRITTALAMEDIDSKELYPRHLQMYGNMFINLTHWFNDEWANKVIDDALEIIEKRDNDGK
jgi:hypothetical protein